ncbi:MAG TPA: phosphate regulon sensor histidine kinase PhoR [Burkholderiales bacterium]|nr:phosphate regulon sensor histidine kinase PhoR [Burkholderiales bacterium]
MNPVLASTLGFALAAGSAGLLAWAAGGPAWGWAAVAAVLGLRVLFNAAHLGAFARWLRAPARDSLPVGRGVWEEVFAGLHRHLKQRDQERLGLVHALARFRDAGRAMPDSVVILDAAGRIEWSNPSAERHFGIDARRDFGQPLTNLVRQPMFIGYLASGEFSEPLMLRSARTDATLSVRLIPFGEDQKLLLARDVTQQETLETMRRDFVANVSHELKTPVTVLSGFVDTLGDESMQLSEAQRRRFLGLMADQASRMRRLIEDLLTLSTLEASAAPDEEQTIEVLPFVDRLAEEARGLSAGRHRVSAEVETNCRLTGSLKELHSALSNLVSNAVRYTPEGGAVRLRWQVVDGCAEFSVEDTGIGIEARHLSRLTERFYRVDNSRSRESGGTGLGLAIVKHVLTRHQARLDIRSEPGRGSRFTAVFPPQRIAALDAAKAAA